MFAYVVSEQSGRIRLGCSLSPLVGDEHSRSLGDGRPTDQCRSYVLVSRGQAELCMEGSFELHQILVGILAQANVGGWHPQVSLGSSRIQIEYELYTNGIQKTLARLI
jgi:hypothetical protein